MIGPAKGQVQLIQGLTFELDRFFGTGHFVGECEHQPVALDEAFKIGYLVFPPDNTVQLLFDFLCHLIPPFAEAVGL